MAGDEFVFSWTFRTKGAISVSAKIIGGGRTLTLNPGTPRDVSGGWKQYSNRRATIMRAGGDYTLRVTTMPRGVGSVQEKKIRIKMASAVLQTLKPTVGPSNLRVTFRVRNRGNAAATGRFQVFYQIQGRNPMRQLVQSSFSTDSMEIRRGATLNLGHITLPNSAWQSGQLWMRVNIGLMGPVSLAAEREDFTYNWPTKTLTINDTLLDIVEAMMTGHVLIDNYRPVSGNRTKNRPFRENASEIKLMTETYRFTFNYIRYKIVGVEHFFFVRNFRANMGGRNFLTIEGGKLCMNVNFDCSASREVKGWVRNWVRKDYSDSGSPDVDIQRFNLKLSLEPVLRGSKVSYRNPRVSISSSMRFPGGWSWLNTFKGKLNDSVKSSVRSGFGSMLNSNDVKTLLENKLTEVVNQMGGALGIHKLISIRGNGNRIIVTYR